MDRLHRQVLDQFYDRIRAFGSRRNADIDRDIQQLKRDVEAASGLPPEALDRHGSPERELFRTLMGGILDGSIKPIPYHGIKHNGSKTMFIMIGTTGAGKSTYAAKLAKNTGAVIVDSNVVKGRPKIDKTVRGIVEQGRDVIVNATHPTRERREELARIARSHGFKTRCIHLDTTKDVAQRRSKLHVRDPQSKVVYFVGAKYFKSFETPGSECDKYNIVTNSGVRSGFGSSASEARTNSILELVARRNGLGNTAASSSKKRDRSGSPNANATLTIPSAMQAHHYDASKHRGPYHVSEKLDGIRALFFNGRLYTRSRNPIQAPQWFLDKIPPGNYDGELYGGSGIDDFHATSGAVMGSPADPRWHTIQYRIFDDWSSSEPFSKTYAKLVQKLPRCSAAKETVCVQPQHVMHDHGAIQRMFEEVVGRGGEGVMLRENTPYRQGVRSTTILKHKKVAEAEAEVVGFEYTGDRVKSLTCTWVTPGLNRSVTFQVGSGLSSAQRVPGAIKLGDIVTVKYMELQTSGKPRHGVFKGVRRNI